MEKGIKELKELVAFIAVFVSAADAATKDGLGFEDATYFIPAMMAAPEAFAGLEEAQMEVKDLDEVEMEELKKVVAEKMDLADDKLEMVVEKALGIGVQMYSLYQDVKVLRA